MQLSLLTGKHSLPSLSLKVSFTDIEIPRIFFPHRQSIVPLKFILNILSFTYHSHSIGNPCPILFKTLSITVQSKRAN